MPTLYVAVSPLMQEWGGDVGISKNLYRAGLWDGAATDAVAEMNAAGYAGQKDWELIGERSVEGMDEAAFLARLADRQKIIDPLYYPRIKGAKDIVKIDQRRVEANLVIKRTMEGHDSKVPKLKPADIAGYILDTLT